MDDSDIINSITRISGKYNVLVGWNPQTRRIRALDFENPAILVHFRNEVVDYFNSIRMKNFQVETLHTDNVINISWEE